MPTPYSIYLSPPDVGEAEQEYVLAALRSGWVAPAGPDLTAFELEVAARVGARHAVAVSSGTAGLHLALVAWGVGPGDAVPVSTLTFAATVNAIRYVGAEPVLVDCDPATGNMDPELLDRALCELLADGARVPVVIAVDLLGKCADYSRIVAASSSRGARVLADSAESLGATHRGRAAGSLGDAAVLSFNGNKIMTTSGGGMLLTDDQELAERVRKLANQAREPVAHYEHAEVGYNYRMSNLLAALGRAQLTRLDAMIQRRRVWRDRYRALFDVPGVRILGGDDDHNDNCWLTAVVVDERVTGWSATELSARLSAQQIESRPVWKPMHLQPVYRACHSVLSGASQELFEHGLALPSGSAMTQDQFQQVGQTIKSALADFGR